MWYNSINKRKQMKYNLQNVKKVLEQNGIKVGYTSSLNLNDINGNSYSVMSYKVSKESQSKTTWVESFTNIVNDKNIDRVIIYYLELSQGKVSDFEWESIEQIRLIKIPKSVEFNEDVDIHYPIEYNNPIELDYELDGYLEIDVIDIKTKETIKIKIKDLYGNFENYGVYTRGDSINDILEIKGIVKGNKKDIYSYSYVKEFHQKGKFDDYDIISCSLNQKGEYTNIYDGTYDVYKDSFMNLEFIDGTNNLYRYNIISHSKKVKERFLYNDYVYSIQTDSDMLWINDIAVAKI